MSGLAHQSDVPAHNGGIVQEQIALFDTPATLGWQELFPSYSDPREIDPKLFQLVGLCGEIGLPFPAERNHAYSVWWHSLHEIGHWAVKPPWYVAYSNWMRDDITIRTGTLDIPEGTIPGTPGVRIENYQVYNAGNDLIPDISLLYDATPGEDETRVWSLQVIQRYGWPHPFDENQIGGVAGVTSGDEQFHKAASARVWFKGHLHNPDIARSMLRAGIDPPSGMFRAADYGFRLPHPEPENLEQMLANMDAVYARYGFGGTTETERTAWINDFLVPRYAGRFH